MKLKELADILREAGIVGAGGAGFPAYQKLDKKADTIILNCSECEPLFTLHRSLLEKFAFEIMTALNEVKTAVGAVGFFQIQILGHAELPHSFFDGS